MESRVCSTWLNLNCRGYSFDTTTATAAATQSRVCIAGRGIELMDLSWLSAILVGAGCLALGYCIGTRRPFCFFLRLTPKVVRDTNTNPSSHHGNKNNNSKEPFETDKLADVLDDFKMVLVVRNDLKMGKGKIAAQCSHATLGLYKKLLHGAPKALNRWEMCAQPKVVVKIESEEDMLVLQLLKLCSLVGYLLTLEIAISLDDKFSSSANF